MAFIKNCISSNVIMQHKLYEQSYPEGERWMMSTSLEATANMWYDLHQNNSSSLDPHYNRMYTRGCFIPYQDSPSEIRCKCYIMNRIKDNSNNALNILPLSEMRKFVYMLIHIIIIIITPTEHLHCIQIFVSVRKQ